MTRFYFIVKVLRIYFEIYSNEVVTFLYYLSSN